MTKRLLLIGAAAGLLALHTGVTVAADQERNLEQVQIQEQQQTQERIYGSQLMTDQERAEYRAKIQAAKSMEEREQIRREHHEQMKERAMKLGVTLPDEPPAMGQGMMGSGGGMGPGGMGPGGMGPGGGMGRGGGR